MADDVSGGKELKTLYNCFFPYGAGAKGALSLSEDGQLCVITEIGVHILRPKSSLPDLSVPLKFSIGLLRNPESEDCFDVGINAEAFCLHPPEFEASYTLFLDRSLNPNKLNLSPPSFIGAAWSPNNYCFHGSCILLVLSSGNRVYYVRKDVYTSNYIIKLDFTEKLFECFKANNFIDDNTNVESKTPNNKLHAEFNEYRQRQYYLAITDIQWCPCIFQNCLLEYSDSSEATIQDQFALLCGCNKLGMLIIWKVCVALLTEELNAEFLASIRVSEEQATRIAWYQESPKSTGYIATSFSNGFINICVIRTLSTRDTIILEEIQKVDVWQEDDLMHVQFMQWLKKDGSLYLIAVKLSHIMVFKIDLDDMGNILAHSYSFAPSTHELPIVALSCKDDFVLTTEEDGTTQQWHLGHSDSTIVNKICKHGYRSFGMQLSIDGLLLFHVVFPTSVIYVKGKIPEKIELIVTTFKPLQAIAEWVTDNKKEVDFEWYEVCRVVTNQMDFHPILLDHASTPVNESTNISQLQKNAYLKWLLVKRENTDVSSDCCSETPDFRLVLQKTVLRRVNFAIEFLKSSEELDENSRKLVLLSADWLISYGNQFDVKNAMAVLELLHETDSLRLAETIQVERFQLRTTGDSGTSKLRMPARESCPLCGGLVYLEKETSGCCDKGHNWKRCSLTLFILTGLKYRNCIFCKRAASRETSDSSKKSSIYRKFVNVNRCCLCNSRNPEENVCIEDIPGISIDPDDSEEDEDDRGD